MSALPGFSINLASDPFRRERAQNAAYAFVCAALACFLLVVLGMILHSRVQASKIRADIATGRAQLQQLESRQSQYSGILGHPQNADVFSHSVFLNQLIARRAVSWTRVFEDLATVMPADVRVEAIRLPQLPALQAGGVDRLELDMSVGTQHPEGVIQLLTHLRASALFGPAFVVSQTPPNQSDPLYRYRVTVAYAQKL